MEEREYRELTSTTIGRMAAEVEEHAVSLGYSTMRGIDLPAAADEQAASEVHRLLTTPSLKENNKPLLGATKFVIGDEETETTVSITRDGTKVTHTYELEFQGEEGTTHDIWTIRTENGNPTIVMRDNDYTEPKTVFEPDELQEIASTVRFVGLTLEAYAANIKAN